MKLKKRIAILSIICVLFCGGVVFGMNGVKHINEMKSQNTTSDKIINEEVNEKSDEYTDLIELLQNQGMDDDKLQYTMEQFFEMTLLYPINDEELMTIKELVKDGADLSKIIDIYTFLQNSNASLKYIKDMYYYGKNIDFYGRYWIEDAFNYCSGQKEYELSMEEVQKYINEGMSIEDIRVANIISRSEVKNIRELLEEKQSGKIWGEIIAETYTDINVSAVKSTEDGGAILECIRLSKISDEPINEVYNDYSQSPQKTTNDIIVPKIIEAEKKVKELNLNVSESDTYFNELKNEVGDSLSEGEIKNLIQQKYTKSEIKQAITISEIDGRNIENVLAENKETNNLNVEGAYTDGLSY